jgi:surface antigen
VSVVSDEVLMAYADGVLAPAERDAVEAIMQRHPECRQKVEKFRATLSPLQNLFRDSVGVENLEPLIERIRHADLAPSPAPARPAAVRQLPQARPMRQARHAAWHQHYPMAIAASLALLIGAGLGSLLQPKAASSVPTASFIGVSDGRLTAQGSLQDLLEHTARGIPVRTELAAGDSWELEAAFTFRSIAQQPCRRYELRSMAQGHFAGFACRDGDGQWTVQAHAKLDSTPVNPGGGFAPASGPSVDAADVALEAAIRAASGGKLYPDADEKAALVAGWAR